MKKLYYIENFSIPGEAAHSIQIENNLKALSKLFDITLISTSFKKRKKLDFCEHIIIKSPKFFKKIIPYRIFYLLYKIKNFKFKKNSYLFTRSPLIAYFFRKKFKKIILEIHDIPSLKDNPLEFFLFSLPLNNIFLRLLKNKKNITFITISQGLKEELIKNNFDSNRIFVLSDGVDLFRFDVGVSGFVARKSLGLPLGKKIVSYIGSLQDWKGYRTFLDSFFYLKNKDDIVFLVVGGSEEEIIKLRDVYEDDNFIFIPFVDYSKIPFFLKASDILVIPNSGRFDISVNYTSPLKLFEYMASKRPIIASDLPSIREVVGDDDVLFFKPDDENDLARKIDSLLNNNYLKRKLANNAYKKVSYYTWEERARKIYKLLIR